jgi:hypothetical protein
MRIVEWNCRMALHRKLWYLNGLNPDIAVVPECAEKLPNQTEHDFSFAWKGRNSNKGIGVLGFNGWAVEEITYGPQLPWVLPVRVSYLGRHAFNILAVWTVVRKGISTLSYPQQISELLNVWGKILAEGNTLLVGDFNCSIQGPSAKPHQKNLDRLEQLGMVSSYHHALDVGHGDEPERTLRWIGPGKVEYRYNCDFIFVPRKHLPGIKAHVEPLWNGDDPKLSDHQPVVADIQTK